MSNPDEIRRDIERTRAELSQNVNALGDGSNPGNIARSQVDKVKEGAHNLKERIFGSEEDPYDDGSLGQAGDRVQQAVGDARQAIDKAPGQLKQRTRGNPLAAGLIAAGIGALIGGLIPASRKEQEYAEKLKDAAEPLVEEVKGMAVDAKNHLQPQAEQAFAEIKDAAQEGAEHVKADAQDAAETVSAEAQGAAEHVRQDAETAVDETKQDVEETRENL